MEYYEYLNYFTLLHVVVIANLGLLAYVVYHFKGMQGALGLIFVTLEEITKGNPVRVIIDEDEEISISFTSKDRPDDEQE